MFNNQITSIMNVTFSIKPKTGKEQTIQFRGVCHIEYSSLYKKLSFKVTESYTSTPKNVANEYNGSCTPYYKVFYDVTSMVID